MGAFNTIHWSTQYVSHQEKMSSTVNIICNGFTTHLFDQVFNTIRMIFINCSKNRSYAVLVFFLREIVRAQHWTNELVLHWYLLHYESILSTRRHVHNQLRNVTILVHWFVHWFFLDSENIKSVDFIFQMLKYTLNNSHLT